MGKAREESESVDGHFVTWWLTQQRHVVGRPRYRVGDVQQEQPEAEQRGHSDVYLLRGRAEEDGQQHRGREDAGKDDVHHVERVFALDEDCELDEGESLVRTTDEEELVAVDVRV